MIKSFLSVLLVFSLVIISACKVTGPADDEWEKKPFEKQSRLFSKDGSALTVFDTDPKNKDTLINVNKGKPEASSSGSNSNNAASDYENYKQWNEAKQNDSAEYEKFKKWQEFEEYNKWKEQQKSN